MAGIQSLLQGPQGQQGLAPGQAQQAPLPGMLPRPTSATPEAEVTQYAGRPTQELIDLFQQRPTGTLMSVIEDRLAAEDMQARVARQMAMGQAAQMGGMSLKDALQQKLQARGMRPTRMAAHGGIMQGYAGGGAVAFTNGGVSEDLRDDERLPVMERIRRARMRQASGGTSLVERPLLDTLVSRLRGETPPPVAQTAAPARTTDTSKLFPFGVPESPMMEVPEIQVAAPAPGPSAAPGGQRRQPSAAPAPATQPALAPQAGLSPEMEAYFRNRASDLRTRQGLPEDIVSGRAGLEALARESIAAQRGEAETFGREARERRDAALARAQRGLLDDPQALLALAGSIDTRKGQGIGSLARGAAGLMGQREADAEAARKEYATAQQTERALQANVRQATMLEAQRAQALREGDFNRANQIKDQIDALMLQRETLLMERRDKAIEQQRQERLAQATERQAKAAEVSAGKPSGTAALLRELGLAPTLENVAKLTEVQQGPKSSAAMRKELVEQWSKNLMLQQKFPNFEDFVAAMAPEAGAAGPGAGEFKILSSRPKT